MSDNPCKVEKQMAKAIFISGDGWLAVFHLLPPSQLGLGIALISPRFDHFVDEHFKTRKWALGNIRIRSKIGQNGTKEMEIINSDLKLLPIAQNPPPKKVIGFNRISISYIDHNVLTFLRHFTFRGMNLLFPTIINDRISELFLHNIWPMLKDNIRQINLWPKNFRHLRQFLPSILCGCPSLRCFSCDVFPAFPPDDSANASDGQAVAKWLLSPRPNGVPKVLRCRICPSGQLSIKMEPLKMAFANASSPVSFIFFLWTRFWFSSFADDSVLPFEITNEFTGERLALKKSNNRNFLLIRCPIWRNETKWTKWENEAIGEHFQWNRIDIDLNEDKMGEESPSRGNDRPK